MGKIPRLGDYLTSEDVNNGDVVTIIEEPRMRSKEETGFERDVWAIKIQLPNKNQKLWTLNKTTYNTLWDTFGDESQDWVGRKIKVTIERRKVRGETRNIIYGDPVEQAKPQSSPSKKEQSIPEIQQLAQRIKQMSPEERQHLDNLARESGGASG